ncbi:putative gamma-glutamyl cyclotransferase, AIG2-like [Lyophyllum shimeji]|uniref:Putative gamma-glutamylcyclotransferase n=1 Tax=Lyophyllum shimeji TaxID=47721 RepID=A0A9P3PRV9_LYOSH|nr:putative gamma-glutamyl cyclotransferase, AIG2-like [Lyophyllum shimeji]
MASAFFYGTLMHPKVLQRVIQHKGAELEICPAILLDYTRHRVKRAEYPGIIPYEQGRALCDRELEAEEKTVRGTLVTGLSQKDMEILDIFEGSEYIRRGIEVHPLGPLVKLLEYPIDDEGLIPSKPPALPPVSGLAPPIKAETYVYDLSQVKRLEPELWSFEEFVKKNAWKWYGEQLPDEDVRWAGGEA